MINNILILTDFSPASWKATQAAFDLAALNNDVRLSILHIYPLASRFSKSKKELELPSKLEEVKTRMNQLTMNLMEHSQDKIENIVLTGNVEERMIEFIQDNDFDLVIIGINSNGYDNNLGSHTLSLIEKTNLPVMVIPNNTSHGSLTS